jgi:hypothetical protein
MVSTSRWGYIDKTGKLAIEGRFQQVHPFQEGRAPVQEKGKEAGFIDLSGTYVVAPHFSWALPFEHGKALVQMAGERRAYPRKTGAPHWGVIDGSGEFVIPAKFSDLGRFREGLAFACEYGAKCGYIDEQGRYEIAPQFDSASDFHEGRAVVLVKQTGGNGFGYIDRAGKMVVAPQFSEAGPFSNGLGRVRRGDRYGYVRRDGKVVPEGVLR